MRISTSNSICHAIEGGSGLISTISTIEAQIVTIMMHERKLHAGCIDPLALRPSISLLRLALCGFAGFDRAKMIGRSLTLEIASMTA